MTFLTIYEHFRDKVRFRGLGQLGPLCYPLSNRVPMTYKGPQLGLNISQNNYNFG